MPRICKILVVEDHDGVRTLLGDVFHDEGYRFTLVADGAEMHEALDRDDYDIAIIDVSLRHGEDGLALATIAREQGCGVIVTSGDPRNQERLDGSGHVYLLKPFKLRTLIELVDRVLKETAARCIRRKRRDGSPFPLRL